MFLFSSKCKTPKDCDRLTCLESEDRSAADTSVQMFVGHYFPPKRANVAALHMAPLATFRRKGYLHSHHHADIQQQRLRVMIDPLPPPSLSLSLPYSSSLGLSETMQTAAATALLSDCHSSSSASPLQPMGYIWQHTILRARQSAWAQQEEPSARADIFQGLFQQMEFLQVPFGVKYLAGGYSIWFITNWMACPAFSSSALHLQALSPPPFMPFSSII